MIQEVEWENEKQRALWLDCWQKASKSGNLEDGLGCRVFDEDFSCMTHLIAKELWRNWHGNLPDDRKVNVVFDAVSIEGETLLHAVVKELFMWPPTAEDVRTVARAVDELVNAGLVLQETPGRWAIHFGGFLTPEKVAQAEARRAENRVRYGIRPAGQLVMLPSGKKDD